MGKRRTGLHPLAYMGVEPSSPPLLVRKPQAPNSNNNENFNIGTIWINNTTDEIWMLTNLDGGVATWTPLESTSITVNADTGSATESSNELNLYGDSIITTSGSGNTLSVSITDNAGTDGQVLIGATGAAPSWENLASSGGSVTITNTANGINLEAAGVAALTSLEGDTGAATPAAGVITVAGGSNITTIAAVNTLTVNLDNSPSVSGSLTAGTSVSAGTSIDSGTTITCGTGLTVTAGGIDSTGTTQLQDLTRGLVFSSATGVLSIDGAGAVGTDGQVVIGATGSDPIWANITSTGSTITITNGANTINLESAITPFNSPYNWTSRPIAGISAGDDITGVAFDGTYWVACTSNGGSSDIYTSTDGISWARTTGTFYALDDVVYDGSTYLMAVGNGGRAYYASNPTIAWTADYPFTAIKVIHDGTNWIVSRGAGVVYYKAGGVPFPGVWSDSAYVGFSNVYAIAYYGGIYVVGGSLGSLSTATSLGGAWTIRTSSFEATESSIRDVQYISDLSLWVAVGDDGLVATATDPTGTWTQRAHPARDDEKILRVRWDDTAKMLVTVGHVDAVGVGSETGQSTIALSQDGINWVRDYKDFPYMKGLGYGDGFMVATGNTGRLKTSFFV